MCVVCAHTAEDLPPAITENIKTIHESVELEVQLIDDLLDLTKIARGKLQLHRQYVEAHELVDRTLRIVDHELLKKKLLLRVHLNAQHHLLHVDPARMQQVFWNIIKVLPFSFFFSWWRFAARARIEPSLFFDLLASHSISLWPLSRRCALPTLFSSLTTLLSFASNLHLFSFFFFNLPIALHF